jgi:hypothetical protein
LVLNRDIPERRGKAIGRLVIKHSGVISLQPYGAANKKRLTEKISDN